MKQLGKLIRAKKAEKIYEEATKQNVWKDLRVESVFGGEAIITQQKTIITEKESDEDNSKIQILLLKHKKVFYLNCYSADMSYANPIYVYAPYVPLQVTPNLLAHTTIPAGTTITIPPGNHTVGSTVTLGSTIILKARSVGGTTINAAINSWSSRSAWNGPTHMRGFRIFIAAKEEKVIIHKLSRALKYDFML